MTNRLDEDKNVKIYLELHLSRALSLAVACVVQWRKQYDFLVLVCLCLFHFIFICNFLCKYQVALNVRDFRCIGDGLLRLLRPSIY